MTSKPLFVREATGLVKSLSPLDLFNVSYGSIMPAVGIVFIVSFSPYAFPQSNMFLAFLLSIPLVGLGPALLYSMLAASIPRTGGDYVYVSRIINPAIGFMTNWVMTITLFSYIALNGVAFSSTALNVFIATIGTLTNNPSLVANSAWFVTSTGELFVGTVMMILVAILMVFGQTVWVFLRVFFVIVMIGTIVNIVYLATVPQSAFVSAWNSQFAAQGLSYSGVIETAVKNGYQPGWTWPGTMGGLVYGMAGLAGFNFSVYAGGEAKSPSKSMLISVVGSLVIGAAIFAIWAYVIYGAFGYEFFSAANYLASCCAATAPLPIPVSVNSLFTIIPQNPVIEIIGAQAFALGWLWLMPTQFIAVTRNLFAWSFDRLAPAKLADVNDRFHSPVKAIILTGIVGEILMILAIYTSFAVAFANTTILLNSVFLIASVAGILFPYTAKSIFELAPSWVKRRFGGVPAITIVGIFSAIVEVILLYGSVTNTFIGGAPVSYPITIGIAILGLVLYFIAKAYRKREGIDLSQIFKTIPPE